MTPLVINIVHALLNKYGNTGPNISDAANYNNEIQKSQVTIVEPTKMQVILGQGLHMPIAFFGITVIPFAMLLLLITFIFTFNYKPIVFNYFIFIAGIGIGSCLKVYLTIREKGWWDYNEFGAGLYGVTTGLILIFIHVKLHGNW